MLSEAFWQAAMGIDLAALLGAARPRETSGSNTVNRYGFQANIGIMNAVELREDGQEFSLVFDIYDDLIVLDSLSAPSEISLYQIKSKEPGEWSIADLCRKVGKTSPRSIVSRLFAHTAVFGSTLIETGFITNAPYSISLANGENSAPTRHRIEAREIHADELAVISKAVLADIDPADVPSWLPKLVLIRTTMGVHGQEMVVKGRLVEHFEKLGVAGGLNITGVYETLHAAVVQRIGYSQEETDQPEVFRRKSLSRSDIDELISRAAATRRTFLADWDIIHTDLAAAGIGTLEIIRCKTHAIAYRLSRETGESNAARLAKHIRVWKEANLAAIDGCATISQLIAVFKASLSDNFGYGARELNGALIVEAYEAINETT